MRCLAWQARASPQSAPIALGGGVWSNGDLRFPELVQATVESLSRTGCLLWISVDTHELSWNEVLCVKDSILGQSAYE